MQIPELLILRHGETEWNAEGRMQGAMNSPLTAKGRDHARDQKAILTSLDLAGWQVRVSPQGRAQETANIALEGLGHDPVTDARLREIEIGDWSGQLLSDIQAGWGFLFETDDTFAWYDHAPGGEGYDGLEARCQDVLDGLEGPTVLICHGITSRMIRALALGYGRTGLGDVPGGQGIVHRLFEGQHTTLFPDGKTGVALPPDLPLETRASGD